MGTTEGGSFRNSARDGGREKTTTLKIRCTVEFSGWIGDLAGFCAVTVATAVDQALRRYADGVGYHQRPPRRLPRSGRKPGTRRQVERERARFRGDELVDLVEDVGETPIKTNGPPDGPRGGDPAGDPNRSAELTGFPGTLTRDDWGYANAVDEARAARAYGRVPGAVQPATANGTVSASGGAGGADAGDDSEPR